MRGFPLLNVILVVAFFAIAWWPLQQAIGGKARVVEAVETASKTVDAGGFSLEVTSSHPRAKFSVSHLNTPVFEIASPGDAMDELELGRELEGIKVPPEGIELWIEASFAGSEIDDQRPVLGLKLVPDNVEYALHPVTLWGDLGEPTIDAPAAFLWKGVPEQP